MKKMLTAILVIAFSQIISAQKTAVKYFIVFKDKNGSPYSMNRPSDYLSERSLARRERQHIAINQRDIPINPNYIAGIKAKGATVESRSKWMNGVVVTISDASKLNLIEALPYVKSVKKMEMTPSGKVDAKFELEMTTSVPVENNNVPERMSGLNYGLAYDQVHMIGADCMHNNGYMGEGMVIAQLDAGWYKADSLPAFDSLRSNGQILGTWDYVQNNAMVYEDYPHGMNVLSCMGGNLPGRIIGTAPKAKYWLLRTEDAYNEGLIEEINWEVAAEFADSVGADVINSSLGYNLFDNAADNHTYADMDGNTTIVTNAADWAASVGIFVTSSAGNSAGAPWYKITAPADADSILTVGAIDSAGAVASFSSRGPTFDGRIKPNTVAKGVGACIAANWGDVTFANGTSFSSPITAGAVACLWQAHPTKTNMEILQAIEESANHYATPDTLTGYGIPNFCTASMILTGISENSENAIELNVYPNPFNSSIEVSFLSNKKQNVAIEVFDVSGRSVKKTTETVFTGENTIKLSGVEALSAGVYVLQLKTSNGTFFKKLIRE